MQGYNQEDALRAIARSIDRKQFSELGPSIDGILRQAQALDLQFMHDTGVLDADGYAGDGYYDDDEAFEFIVEEIVRQRDCNEEQAVLVAAVVDAYMGAQAAYLHRMGLEAE